MRKNVILLSMMLLLVCLCSCGNPQKIKVYPNTEDPKDYHTEAELTAVVSKIDLENKLIEFVNCYSGTTEELVYHSGVAVYNTHGTDVGIGSLELGTVVDVNYYLDTKHLVDINISKDAVVLSGMTKLFIDKGEGKASCKGKTYKLTDFSMAFDDGNIIDIMEINPEDMVCMNVINDKLVSAVLEKGHGYVRLYNQEAYVGGMVEVGNDVIIPVTHDMLVAVREGDYTLRISKNGYSNSKPVSVKRNEETRVDISTIDIPKGTVKFNITPSFASLYINGTIDGDHKFVGNYGVYSIKIEADGYRPFKGSIKIAEPTKQYNLTLVKLENDTESSTTEETTTEESETETGTGTDTGTDTDTSTETGTDTDTGSDTEATTEGNPSTEATTEQQVTSNKITVKSPEGVSVYLDGDYIGIAPVTFTKTVGTHTITLYKTGYIIKSYTIISTNNGKDDEYKFAALIPILGDSE